MFGCQKVSHKPNNCSPEVPIAAKSVLNDSLPMRSIELMNGSLVFGSRPTMIGSTKYGPNLENK